MKYELRNYDDEGREVIMRFEEVSLWEVLNQIKYFLQACSFTIDGNLDIVKDDYADNFDAPRIPEIETTEEG